MSVCSIFTATSNTGLACIEELYSRKDYSGKVKVRGVFRSAEKAEQLSKKYPDLEVVVGVDADKPETLSKAFVGAEKAFIICPFDLRSSRSVDEDVKMLNNVIHAAVDAEVKYIILL